MHIKKHSLSHLQKKATKTNEYKSKKKEINKN